MNLFDFIEACQKANPAAKVTCFLEGDMLCIRWHWDVNSKVLNYEVAQSIARLRQQGEMLLNCLLQYATEEMAVYSCGEENNRLI
ncbi:hypothetical protein I2492_05970 [Budviciaceae bacterium CWB-B4]|uniref:Uncharacterized protein n=1 Tax=Limnobaculum xujianqingii TaxID=2738837 RepID=A0A9D7FSC6_9GAMM|nr:hypothetical protein [Limnobaculum xujianqingii]MBK5072555.1 hypothetical protein [Limnobaculum xujianqingii]MBK5175864.1 hypothetical protein [Limnobaculum xujianqingii]